MSGRAKWEDGRLVAYDSARPSELISPFSPGYLYEDFVCPTAMAGNDAAILNAGASQWNVTIVNGGTTAAAADADANGVLAITTGNADDDNMDVATNLVYYAECAPSIEVRAANEDISQLCHFIGFSDAITEGADTAPFGIVAAALTSTCTDGAGFLMDPDATEADAIWCVSVNGDADGTHTDSGTDAVDGVYHTYRVDIDTAGNAQFWLDGSLIYTEALAVATTAALCGIVSIINHVGVSDVLNVDYIRIWSNRTT